MIHYEERATRNFVVNLIKKFNYKNRPFSSFSRNLLWLTQKYRKLIALTNFCVDNTLWRLHC